MDQTPVRSTTATTGKTALAIVAIFSLMLSLLAIARPVAADHSGFDHQPLPIDTATFVEDAEECEGADLEPGQVLLHWIASQQNVTEAITLTLFLEGGGELTADSYQWNEPAHIDGNVTHHFEFILDADIVVEDLEISTGEGNVRLSHVCRGDENGGEEGEDLVLIKQDLGGTTLDGVGFTLGDGDEMLTVGGQITFENLAEGSWTLTETSNPDQLCETGGTLTVVVSAEGDITVTDDDEADGLAIVSFDAETNTLVLSNDCEENGGEEGEGSVEIDKLFCSSDEGTRTEIEVNDPITPSFGAQSEGTAPEDGCVGGEASFEIYLADEMGNATGDAILTVSTGDDGSETFTLDAGTYVIVETSTGASATFTVEDGALTIIEVTNFESGLVKVIKEFCEGEEDAVLFSINGSEVTGFDPDTCEEGEATFRLNDGAEFVVDGEAVVPAEVGTNVLHEVSPNVASSDEFEVAFTAEGEFEPITTIHVFDVEGENGGEEGEGSVEIDKLFCSSDEGTRTEIEVNDPITPSFGAQSEGTAPEDGCVGGEASFTIYTADEGGEPTGDPVATAMTDASGEIKLDLEPGAYVIVEDETGASATFTVEGDMLTIIEVTNFESGLVKVIKLSCVGDEEGVLFSIDGSAVTGFDPDTCEEGDGTFQIDDGASFTTIDGEALVFASVGTHTLAELFPNTGTSAEFEVAMAAQGEFEPVTTIRVFNLEGEGVSPGTGGGGNQTPNQGEGTMGGSGGPGAGGLPNTAMSPSSTGSVPAALLALLMLSGLGAAAYAVRVEAQRRR